VIRDVTTTGGSGAEGGEAVREAAARVVLGSPGRDEGLPTHWTRPSVRSLYKRLNS